MKRTALTIVAAGIVAATVVLGIALWALWPDRTTEHHDTAPSHSEHADHDHGSDHDHAITDPLAPDNATITAATEQAFRAMFTWQPVSDNSPGDAVLRARPWLGGELADTSGRDTNVRLPADWQAWRQSGDLITATAAVTDEVSTTGTTAVRSVRVVQNVMRPTGETVPYAAFTARAELTRTDGGWRVTAYTLVPTT